VEALTREGRKEVKRVFNELRDEDTDEVRKHNKKITLPGMFGPGWFTF
jgi:hypothetical protein